MASSLLVKGSYAVTEAFLQSLIEYDFIDVLYEYARQGRERLAAFTPVDTGFAASSWWFEVNEPKKDVYEIVWGNSDVENGFPVAIMRQYGYGRRDGGYVEGIDYINPALEPIFGKILDAIWQEVTQ